MKRIIFLSCILLLFSPLVVIATNSTNSSQIPIYVTIKPNNTIIVEPAKNTIIIPPQNNTKIEQLIQKLTDEPKWKNGDIIITSGTVFAFFAFGSLLVIKFESERWKQQLNLMTVVLGFIAGIQILHLSVIIFIMLDKFNPIFYIGIIITTIGFLIIILSAVRRIIYLENTFTSKSKNVSDDYNSFRRKVEDEQKSIREYVQKKLDNVDRLLDDTRRERIRINRELGE